MLSIDETDLFGYDSNTLTTTF